MVNRDRLVVPLFFFFNLVVLSCTTTQEQPVIEIPLAGDLIEGDPEISSLAWYEDKLVLLCQYPSRFLSEDHGQIFAIPKNQIVTFLDKKTDYPIVPGEVPFFDNEVQDLIDEFEGFEAIVFQEDKVFLTIEARKGKGRIGYLVSGSVKPGLSAIHLNASSLTELIPRKLVGQMAYETLLSIGGGLLAIFEANGRVVNTKPEAKLIDMQRNPRKTIPFPAIEYRVTDATSVDVQNKFWAINYFYPGEQELKPNRDPIVEKYGQGTTHTRFEAVERLVEFQASDSAITLVDRPPIQLTLHEDGQSRNWEGIVRLDRRGFLIATDTHPKTILAFVPMP